MVGPLDLWGMAQMEFYRGNKEVAANYIANALGGEETKIIEEHMDVLMDPISEAHKLLLIGIVTRERAK